MGNVNDDNDNDNDLDEEEEDETSFLMNTDDATNYGTDRDDTNDNNSINDNDGSFDDDWLRIKGSSRTLMSDEYKEYNSNHNNDDDNHPTNTNTNTNNTNIPTSTKNDKDTKIQEDSFLRSLMTGGDNDNDIDITTQKIKTTIIHVVLLFLCRRCL